MDDIKASIKEEAVDPRLPNCIVCGGIIRNKNLENMCLLCRLSHDDKLKANKKIGLSRNRKPKDG